MLCIEWARCRSFHCKTLWLVFMYFEPLYAIRTLCMVVLVSWCSTCCACGVCLNLVYCSQHISRTTGIDNSDWLLTTTMKAYSTTTCLQLLVPPKPMYTCGITRNRSIKPPVAKVSVDAVLVNTQTLQCAHRNDQITSEKNRSDRLGAENPTKT